MQRSDAWRVVMVLSMLMLVPVMTGCPKKKKVAEAPATQAEPARNPLNVQPGGAPAQGVVRRGAERQVNQQILRDIGQYYMLYKTEQGRAPRDMKEFLTYLKSDPNARTAKVPQVLEGGTVIMVFTPEPSSNQVLAYEKEIFKQFQNRLALFGDGSVKLMGEAEFQAALKAR